MCRCTPNMRTPCCGKPDCCSPGCPWHQTVTPPVDISRDLIISLCEQHGFEYVAQTVVDEWRKRDWKKREWVDSPLNKALAGELSCTERKAIHHMLWIWLQYASHTEHEEGKHCYLPHQCMQAGERATDFLEARGLAKDQGWQAELTADGLTILEDDSLGEEGS